MSQSTRAPMPTASRRMRANAITPTVQYSAAPVSDAAAKSLYSASEMMSKMVTRIDDQLDKQAAIDGAREGTIAGGADTLPKLKDEMTIRGAAFNASARRSAGLRLETDAVLKLNDLEQKNLANPGAFKSASSAYLRGVVDQAKAFDPAMAQDFEAQFSLRAEDAGNRILNRQREIVRDQQTEHALRMQMTLRDEVAQYSADLFNPEAGSTKDTLAKMISTTSRMVNLANERGPDGRPLFNARERLAVEQEAEDAMNTQIGLSWMRSQPDALAAFDAWHKGEAKIRIADDQGNAAEIGLRDLLGERGYQKASNAFFDNLRSELALEAQVETARDRAFKDSSDQIWTDFSILAQEGKLTLPLVDDVRSQVEPEKYLALRELARGGAASVSDGATVARLTTNIVEGQDNRDQIRMEYRAGNLTTADYTALYTRNTETLRAGTKDAITVGRDFVGGALGRNATELGITQSLAIPPAEAEYAVRVEQFQAKEGRQPTTSEALDIGREVVRRYATNEILDTVMSLPLPKFMSAGLKTNAMPDDVEAVAKKTVEHFLNLHGGNREAMKDDPVYIDEMILLKRYDELARARAAQMQSEAQRSAKH